MSPNTIKKKLLTGGIWAFLGKILASLVGFSIHILLARLLSPNDLGNYFLIISLISFASTFALFGLLKTLVKMIAESLSLDEQGKIKETVIYTFQIVIIGTLLTGGSFIFGLNEWVAITLLDSPDIAKLTGLIVIWFTLLIWQQVIAEIYRGYHNIKLATLFNGLMANTLFFFSLFTYYHYHEEIILSEVIKLVIASYFISVSYSGFRIWNKLKGINSKYTATKTTAVTQILSISWPIWVTSLSLLFITQIDIWLLGVLTTQENVAIYGMAVRLLIVISMPLLIINAVVPPIISQLHAQKNKNELQKTLRLTATIAATPSIIALIIFIFYGENILVVFFGEFYRSSANILVILSVGQVFNVLSGSCGLALMLTKHQKTMMTITLFSGIITFLFSWYLIYDYGVIGVAVGTTFGLILQNILMLLLTRYKLGIWTHFDPFILFNKKTIK